VQSTYVFFQLFHNWNLYVYLYDFCVFNLKVRFFICIWYSVFQTQYYVHYSTVRYKQYVVFSNMLFKLIPCTLNTMKELLRAFTIWPCFCPTKCVPIYSWIFCYSI